jgi:putative toxin-antitoxin system antitoxin component (TIGR02293 family)
MKESANNRAGNKTGSKSIVKSVRSKSAGGMIVQKRELTKDRTNLAQAAGKGLDKQTKPAALFSYKSADDKNILAIIDAVRTGISFTAFEKIVSNAPFSLAEWSNYLQLSERTIQRAQKEKKSFQPIQSERIIELAMLYEYGVDVFGDKENFNIWLNSRSVALGGRTPKELLDTKFGVLMVKDELGRIEHGVLA